jgi:hypothetical protein
MMEKLDFLSFCIVKRASYTSDILLFLNLYLINLHIETCIALII